MRTWLFSLPACYQRRQCWECGMVSNPGAIGHHQNRRGHWGYTDLDELTVPNVWTREMASDHR